MTIREATRRVTDEPARELDRARVEFLGLELAIARGVLVPRKETELLARTALRVLAAPRAHEPLVIDVCCGAGNLTCAIAASRPSARVFAADLSARAVELTLENAERLGLAGRIVARCGDLFAPLAGLGLEGTVDLVVCNPPYISSGRLDGPARHLLADEPREAFDGGPYGIGIHQRVVREAAALVRPGGALALEFGGGQERQLAALLRRSRAWTDIELYADESGEPRAAVARRSAAA